MGRGEHCKQISVACVGSACSVCTTLGLPQLMAHVLSQSTLLRLQVALQVELSEVGSGLHVLLRSKLLRFRFLGTPQKHRLRLGSFAPFPGLSNSGNQVLGEHTVPCGLCILITSPVPATQFPG